MRHLKHRSYYHYQTQGQFDHSKTLRELSSDYSPETKSPKKLQLSFHEKKSLTQTQRTDVSKPFFQNVINRISNNLDIQSDTRAEPVRPEGLRIPLERLSSFGITLNEVPSPDKRSNKQPKTLEALIPDISPIARNHSRTQTTMGEKPRITLKLLDGSQTGTHLTRDNLDNSPSIINQSSGKRYHIKRGAGSTTRNFYRGDQSTTGMNETSQNITWRTVNQSMSRYPLNVREAKINKILQDVQVSLEIGDSREKDFLIEDSPGLPSAKKKISCLRTSSPLGKSSPIRENRVMIVENQSERMDFKEVSQKLGDIRSYINNQLVDLKKVRAPLKLKTKSVSENMFVRIKNTVSKQPQRATGIKRREIALKLSKTIKAVLRKLALLNLTMEQIMAHKVFPNGPYERPGSKEFIDFVKAGDYREIENILNTDVFHIYDYDLLKQTALHWAAKRGSPRIMKLLLEKGADPDASDLSGRTPLFLAAKGGFLTCVKLLIFYRADPTIRSGADKICLDYTTDANIRELITKAYKIHIRLSVLSPKKFKECWEAVDKRDFLVLRKELNS